jgi:hypothetical protein
MTVALITAMPSIRLCRIDTTQMYVVTELHLHHPARLEIPQVSALEESDECNTHAKRITL